MRRVLRDVIDELRHYGLVFFVLLLASGAVFASPERVRISEVSRGELLLHAAEGGYFAAPPVDTAVLIRVSGPVVRTKIRQRFDNPLDLFMEGTYAFPLPEDAAVDHMRMQIGDRLIEGQVQEKEQARRTYEQAKAEGKVASLLDQARPNLFTTAVANIPPKGEVIIEIEYQHLARWSDASFSLRFPMAITPRFNPAVKHQTVIDAVGTPRYGVLPGEMANAVAEPEDPQGHIRLTVELEPGVPVDTVQSRYHAITQEPLRIAGSEGMRIRLQEDAQPADRDFELVWTPRPGHQPTGAFLTQEATRDGYYSVLMLMPPAPMHQPEAIARELIFIIDTSGSMAGPSMRQAKAALQLALKRLRPIDSFNIIRFSDAAEVLFGNPRLASAEALTLAQHFVEDLEADGGTNMQPALEGALAQENPFAGSRMRQVLFLTDGAVGNEKELFTLIEDHLGEHRLFTVGIGSAPNSYFMRKAAQFGRGTFTHIGREQEVEEKLRALFAKMEKPLLTNIEVDFGVYGYQLPERIPDLYGGEPITVALQSSNVPKEVTLKGRYGSKDIEFTVPLQQAKTMQGLDTHWGRQRIEEWMDRAVLGTPESVVRREIVELALRHHLVSKYTSLVAVDVTPVRPADQDLLEVKRLSNRPQGLRIAAAQTATPMQLLILSGLLLLITAGWLWNRERRDAHVA
jgi:Ca-activated chloride channel family protein